MQEGLRLRNCWKDLNGKKKGGAKGVSMEKAGKKDKEKKKTARDTKEQRRKGGRMKKVGRTKRKRNCWKD